MRARDSRARPCERLRARRPGSTWIAAWIGIVAVLAQAELATATPVRVLLIGDSITQGLISGPNGVDYKCSEGLCYAERLEASLGDGYSVVNAGIGGASTTDWVPGVTSLPYVVVDGEPRGLFDTLARPRLPTDFVVIMLGVNDAIGFFEIEPVSPNRYRENLSKTIAALIEGGVSRILLVKPSPVFGVDVITQRRVADYGAEIDLLCSLLEEVVCGPDLLALLTPVDFEGDDVHPNAGGHAKIAASLVEHLGAIPEPTTAVLLGLGMIGLICRSGARPPSRRLMRSGIS